MNETNFEHDLRELINRHSLENRSDTPDFILAKYVLRCLEAFAHAQHDRDEWFDFRPWGGHHNPHPQPEGAT